MPQQSPTPTWNHPLFGANPSTLITALASNGPLPPVIWPFAAALLLASCLRSPLSWGERALAASVLRRSPPPRSPVFILGHWRSGTTHLFNLMGRDPRFAWADPFATGMPWDFLLLGRLIRPLTRRALPRHRYIDAVAVNPDAPQEDEIALASMQNLSYYHGIYFPRRFERHYRRGVHLEDVEACELDRWRRRFQHYNRKFLIGRSDKTLLVKNPVYTARVRVIRELWPDARFIHIRRNPYVVYESTRKFYRALLPRFALQEFDPDQIDELVLQGYPAIIDKLYKDVRELEPYRYAEISFEDLECEPLAQLEHIYGSLGIPGFTGVAGRFESYLDSISNYRKNSHVFSAETVARVDRQWGGLVRRWGYDHPETRA